MEASKDGMMMGMGGDAMPAMRAGGFGGAMRGLKNMMGMGRRM